MLACHSLGWNQTPLDYYCCCCWTQRSWKWVGGPSRPGVPSWPAVGDAAKWNPQEKNHKLSVTFFLFSTSHPLFLSNAAMHKDVCISGSLECTFRLPLPAMRGGRAKTLCFSTSQLKVDSSQFTGKGQMSNFRRVHSTLNLSSQGLWSSWIIWRGSPRSRMIARRPASTPRPPWTPAQWPFSCRGGKKGGFVTVDDTFSHAFWQKGIKCDKWGIF